MRRWLTGCSMVLAVLAVAPGAVANDSMAELALGGLVLRQSDHIAMVSEDLFISRDEVRVAYVYHNTSRRDVTSIVAFPLPDVDYADRSPESNAPDIASTVDGMIIPFRTSVNGVPVALQTELRSFAGTRDITQRLRALGFPPVLTTQAVRDDFRRRIDALDSNTRAALVREGILQEPEYEPGVFVPAWRTTINVWRQQTFPAQARVRVEHAYAPIVGGSAGSSLAPEYRASVLPEYRRRYCVDSRFLAGIDRRLAAGGGRLAMQEIWIGYVLKTGANWAGPIGTFTLTVDKGEAGNLVSFCGEGVRRISPTRFQMTRTNYTPTADLEILLLTFSDTGQ